MLSPLPRPVGAGLPAKEVNDNAFGLAARGARASFAGKPAPTGGPGVRKTVVASVLFRHKY
ncbi:hypothetical protein ELQ88_20075 [Pseudomonas sp. MPC6]|nr:hypothetical protein ELQ88_20075 [Pseudomonas sp. MPC6]